jgi:hypothetical protein
MVLKMKKIILFIFLILGFSLAGEWENFSLRENGTIPVWTVAGPFPNGHPEFHGEGCFGFFRNYLVESGGEKTTIPRENQVVRLDDGKKITWKSAFSQADGLLDFIDIFEMQNGGPGVAYAFCQLISSEEKSVILKVRSNDGVRIWFNGTLIHNNHVGRTIDQAQDDVEVSLLKGNNPLLIKVDQGGGKWALSVTVTEKVNQKGAEIFSATYREIPLKNKIQNVKIRATPLVQKTTQGERQIISIDILSGGLRSLKLKIRKKEWEEEQSVFIEKLSPGENTLQIQVPVVKITEPATLLVESESDRMEFDHIVLPEVKKWTVYLVQHVHTDIGYTRSQTEILPEHLRFIDYALDFCDLTDDYPDDAKFRWTCEVTWPVNEYLKRRGPSQIERLIKRVKEGRIEIAGMFLNMSELSSERALTASLQPIREIKKYGIPVLTALQNDVNGIGWGLVDYFEGIGIKYVSMGINKTRSVLPFDKPTPFWWESPSGKKVLAYRADHYHVGNFWKLQDGHIDDLGQGMQEYLANLQNIKYPFNQISVQYSGYHTDNSPPSTFACDLVKDWNENYAWPKLRIATVSEFLQDIEEHHKEELPVFRTAWPDWWTDGFGSAARETAEARITQNELSVSEGLLAMASLMGEEVQPETIERAATVQDALLFYQEHTFGAAESISDPLSANSMIQWGEKSSYVWEAVKNQGLLREEALGLLWPYIKKNAEPTLVVFNTLNWVRSGLVEVFIDHEILPENAGFKIMDSISNKEVLAQAVKSRNEGTYWALWVPDIPAMGFKSFRILKGQEYEKPKSNGLFKIDILENSFYRLSFDTLSGTLSNFFDKELKRELMDHKTDFKPGQFIYEKLPQGRDFDREAFIRTGIRNVKPRHVKDGPIWQSVTFTGESEGCREPGGVNIEYRLYKPEKRIEIIYRIFKERSEMAEACYVAFPFDSKFTEIIYEAQGGIVSPGKNQLPGSSSDWHTVQNFTALKNDRAQIVLSSPEIPLVQFGDFNLGKWQYMAEIKEPKVYSWVMNNYWYTNFRAYQEGEFKWHYFLTSASDISQNFATRFGWNSNSSLVARVFTAGSGDEGINEISTLNTDSSNILLVNARPVAGGVIIHLREIEGKSTTMPTNFNKNYNPVSLVNVLGEEIAINVEELSFRPYETKFIKLNIQPAEKPGR